LVKDALSTILGHVKDAEAIVRDTAAWTIGRICQHVPEAVGEQLPALITAFGVALHDRSPKIAAHACWAIHNLADSVHHNGQTSPLSPYFKVLLKTLLSTSER
jgi:importin subunit beta-1